MQLYFAMCASARPDRLLVEVRIARQWCCPDLIRNDGLELCSGREVASLSAMCVVLLDRVFLEVRSSLSLHLKDFV